MRRTIIVAVLAAAFAITTLGVDAEAHTRWKRPGTYKVGRHIAGGVWKLKTIPDGRYTFCYWRISKDPNGRRIIDNYFQRGKHRTFVELKGGQWFHIDGCKATRVHRHRGSEAPEPWEWWMQP